MKVLKKLRRELLVGLSKLGIKNARIRRGDLTFQIPLFHGMGRFLFVTHEPWRTKVLDTVNRMGGGVVLDVGVNVGQTLLNVKEFLPNATYYGFEPNPACVFYVNDLIRLNHFQSTYVLPFGLGESNGMMKLYSTKWDDASSSLEIQQDSSYETIVYVRSGDEFIEEEGIDDISFIKIDTEGFEYQVLLGLKETIRKHQPIIYCEIFSDNKENPKIYEFFKDLDYLTYEQASDYKLKVMNEASLFNNRCYDYIFASQKNSEEFERHFNND